MKVRALAITCFLAIPGFFACSAAQAPEYERVLGFPVRFGQSTTRIVFERRILDEPQLHADVEVERVLEGQADRRLRALSAASVSARVRAPVEQQYGGNRPSMNHVARRMWLSSRSLRRRLRAEGVTYEEVAQDAVAELARRLLQDPATTIQQVAARLGFSEASAFHRAFKRWIGLTPTEFREGLTARESARERSHSRSR
jgi:AraC-like DNA-binding protein